ncbi:MAG: 4-hydroxy-3-methylbut-2-enyl diphosphate reductase [Treponema sp.]|jgi:4-hydroxy-3-methylbut-2-enyl diphosphate reductase|nr:4-hydroxy-3-methylbut-2-enyl diphosphate reductase [Treponema sp.]
MKVIRAKVLGFCFGVRRALDMCLVELEAEGRVYSMGALIHNPQAMERLKQKGLRLLDEDTLPPVFSGATVIIRAHGVSPRLEAELLRRGARLVDATCPKVKANQLKIRSLCGEGYEVFLAGERNHGEVIGMQAFAPGCILVENGGEAENAAAELKKTSSPFIKTALIGQTTISAGEYTAIEASIKKYFPDLETVNSICNAVAERQESLRELCGMVDAVIVAGGRASSNTRRLFALALAEGKPAWLVEDPSGLEELKPPNGGGAVNSLKPPGPERLASCLAPYQSIGLCAGASTPDEVIDQIEARLKSLPDH